jgi:threonine/homoserine/homoserine lactone efflux protein
MIAASTLFAFLPAVALLLAAPGPNMAFVMSHGVAHGPRAGLAAALGIFGADLALTLASAMGITAVVAGWPPSFDLVRYCGAAYLAWLALGAWRAPRRAIAGARTALDRAHIVRSALLGSLLNPKALLFFMLFLPQFVDPARASVPLQLALLGAILSLAALAFHCALGVFAGRIGAFFGRYPRAAGIQRRLLALAFAGLALRLLFISRGPA